jgi:hypothetical protein
MTRALLLLGVLGLASCDTATRFPFVGLGPGACKQDSECAVALCPSACNEGRPWCQYPRVFSRADIVVACPCFEQPATGRCAPPQPEACGPLPGCAGPFDVDQVRAVCAAGTCVARLSDGGVPSP